MEETQNKLEKKVGTKERPVLEPKPVKIAGVKLDPKLVRGKETDIVVVVCVHPDREETIEISKIKQVKGKVVSVSGLWYNEDEDGNIQKGSAVAELMNLCKVESLNDLVGKEIETVKESDSVNYLVIKGY